jgi:hypothetical protein
VGFADRKAEQKSGRGKRRKSQLPNRAWSDVPRELIGEFVAAIVSNGRGCLLGTTSDGGALVVRVYDGGDAETDYIKPNDDVATILSDIAEDYTGEPLPNDLGS